MDEMKNRAHKAAKMFLKKRGFDILEEHTYNTDIIADDEGTIVFVKVSIKKKGTEIKELSSKERAWFVSNASDYAEGHKDFCEKPFRLDHLNIYVIDGERAIIEHHVNASGPAQTE